MEAALVGTAAVLIIAEAMALLVEVAAVMTVLASL